MDSIERQLGCLKAWVALVRATWHVLSGIWGYLEEWLGGAGMPKLQEHH